MESISALYALASEAQTKGFVNKFDKHEISDPA